MLGAGLLGGLGDGVIRKVVSLPWIWTLTNDYTVHAELIDIHKG